MMPIPLRVLLVEDSGDDAFLLECDLKDGGYDPLMRRVETAEEMRQSLIADKWDIVISDYAMPGFSGMEALSIYKSFNLDVPFILISGAVGEDVAIDAMVHGAHDYVMKDKKARLLPAIERELREAALRRDKTEMETRFRVLFETMAQGIVYYNASGRIISANSAAERILGCSLKDIESIDLLARGWRYLQEDGSILEPTRFPTCVALESGKPVWNMMLGIERQRGRRVRWVVVDAVPQFRGGESTPFEVYTTFQDVTERRESQEALERSESRYRRITEKMTDYIYTVNMNEKGIIETMHGPGCRAVTGYSAKEFYCDQNLWITMVVPEDRHYVLKWTQGILKEGEIHPIEHRIIRKDGSQRWVKTTPVPRYNADGNLIEYDALIQDITERKEAEEALRESEERYRRLYELSPLGYQSLDADGCFINVNDAWLNTLGYCSEEVVGRWFGDFIAPHLVDEFRRRFPLFKEAGATHTEFEMIRKDGTRVLMAFDGRIGHDEKGRFKQTHCILRDITAQRQAEEDIKTSLREKEVLLREIHHRVKNNLQVISSLLALQSGYIKDPGALEMFKESTNRIRTMAHIHEKLYQSRDYERIKFSDYIDELAGQLYGSYGLSPERVGLRTNVTDVFLDINRAIPLGLITNELVSNAMKHAFSDGRKGEIVIALRTEQGGTPSSRVILSVSDNGKGFPADIDFRRTDSLGLQLVMELTEQLEGEIELIKKGGRTSFVVSVDGV